MKKEEKKEQRKNVSTKTEEVREKIPVLYYVILCFTVISTLFLVLAGYKKMEVADIYSGIVREAGAQQEYVDYYFGNHQSEGLFDFGLAGFTLMVGLFASDRVKRK